MIRFAFVLSYLAFFLTACSSGSYQAEMSFANGCWDAEAPLGLNVQVAEGEALNRPLIIGLQFDQEYPYQNLYLQVIAIDKEGNATEMLVYEQVIEENGEWKAPISRGKVSWEIPTDFPFPKAGEYKIQVRQYLRDEYLCGIHKVGVSFE